MRSLARFVAVAALAVWIGGLTFYALVVIPIGTEVVGRTMQGLITQGATNWLNAIGVVALVLLLPSLRARWMLITWGALAVTLVALVALHTRLDALLVGREVANHDTFYNWHRAYLLVTAAQWLAGLVHLRGLVQPDWPPVPLPAKPGS